MLHLTLCGRSLRHPSPSATWPALSRSVRSCTCCWSPPFVVSRQVAESVFL